jgi:hypothetical protein
MVITAGGDFGSIDSAEELAHAFEKASVRGQSLEFGGDNATTAVAGYTCDQSYNFVNGAQYSQISLTSYCPCCSCNPVYGAPNDINKAVAYCQSRCDQNSDCTGFFFQRHTNGHEICGFYAGLNPLESSGKAKHGHATGSQLCTKLSASTDSQMVDLYKFWNTFRDPDNGLYCDAIYLGGTTVCGPGNHYYSLASVGMGLVAECVFAELGFHSQAVAKERVTLTIDTVKDKWPKESGKGFFQHFTNQGFIPKAEYSTIDTAIGTLGALFAGKYFKGEIQTKALELARKTSWTAGIKGAEPPLYVPSSVGTVPSSCAPHISWGYTSGKNEGWYQTAYANNMYIVSGVSIAQATYQDFQRMYKCLNLNAHDCNDKGLEFPTVCSKPPCNACGTVPSSCAPHITWGHTSGKNEGWYQTAYAKKLYLVSGVSFAQATYQDFQRMYKCLNLSVQDCNDKGLEFPTVCSKPPCNACLESIMYLSASQSGDMLEGILKPFNEYYLLAYLATKAELQPSSTTSASLELAARYFEVFFGTTSPPLGDGEFPKVNPYPPSEGTFQVLSDQDGFIPSFHVQFNYFLTSAFGQSTFYLDKIKAAMGADMKFWELNIPSSNSLHGKVWGLGAGLAPGPKYEANSISKNANLTFSAPIMAGFLKADPASTATILGQLRYMYSNNICRYEKPLEDGSAPKFLWRCSIMWPGERANRVESVDFSTMVFGFAQQYLPSGFYQTFGY